MSLNPVLRGELETSVGDSPILHSVLQDFELSVRQLPLKGAALDRAEELLARCWLDGWCAASGRIKDLEDEVYSLQCAVDELENELAHG